MYGISLLQIVLVPHSAALASPPLPPAPIVRPLVQDPTTTAPAVVTPAPPLGVSSKAPAVTAPTTTTTTTPAPVTSPPSYYYSGLECVVTLTDNLGNAMEYATGPAINGVCTDGIPTQENVTSNVPPG